MSSLIQPELRRNLPAIGLVIYIVVGIATILVWSVVSILDARRAGNKTVQVDAPPLIAPGGTEFSPMRALTSVPPLINDGSVEAKEPPQLAVAPPASAPQSNSLQATSSALVLDNDEIATLLKRGEAFLTNGDLASARLLLSRAAEAGSAEAALELGATFDPLILQQRGVIGVEPDIARARKWYQRAAELGSTVATQQLAKLNGAR